jgi:hypothetical protein
MVKALLRVLLFTEIRWWEWKGQVKFLLWLTMVLGVIGWGIVRLDESSQEMRTERRMAVSEW